MKRIDRMIVQAFVPPFFVMFMIAAFVFIMQTLWIYIDDIAGKGLSMLEIVELLAYKCVAVVPMSLPIAVLIASVMVLGNSAERYELSSMKSAGISLLRVMRPIMLFAFGATIISWYCSNNLIPAANLKFGSRMFDITNQKPTLRLEGGAFTDAFEGFSIFIGEKGSDGRSIKNVLIYDMSNHRKDVINQIVAKEGEMYASPDGKLFVMNLRDGTQYVEVQPSASSRNNDSQPFVRTSFKEWTKVFDMSQFEIKRSDEELFKQNRSMLSIGQLQVAIDSISGRMDRRQNAFAANMSTAFYLMQADSTLIGQAETPEELKVQDSIRARLRNRELFGADKPDTTKTVRLNIPKEAAEALKKREQMQNSNPKSPLGIKGSAAARATIAQPDTVSQRLKSARDTVKIKTLTDFPTLEAYLLSKPDFERQRVYDRARSFARTLSSQSESAQRSLDSMDESKIKHIYDLYMKYSIAVACFLFVFIGAPMGAIIRKGGFGYPILVSIVFFIVFIILTIFCRKIAEAHFLPAAVAAWVPSLVLFPTGVFLTYKAMNDSQLLDIDRYAEVIQRFFKNRKNKQRKDAGIKTSDGN
ncbi:MAG: LptF/LptG family permease [Saprospiraceae bacterium]